MVGIHLGDAYVYIFFWFFVLFKAIKVLTTTWLVGSDNCKTSIVDFHRSCSNCSYDLCLTCCREIRNGSLQGGAEELIVEYVDRGKAYMHGGKPFQGMTRPKRATKQSIKSIAMNPESIDANPESIDRNPESIDMNPESIDRSPANPESVDRSPANEVSLKSEWKMMDNGSIPCASCGSGLLELKYILPRNLVSDLEKRAEEIANKYELFDVPASPTQRCSCFNSVGDVCIDNNKLRRAASREDQDDNYLYCPTAKEIQHGDLAHFQKHWVKGEPVIVRNVAELSSGLSWEPLVMCRALREKTNSRVLKGLGHLEVKAVDCMDWCEVSFITFFCINLYKFFITRILGTFFLLVEIEIYSIAIWRMRIA